ncbi:MAG: hypothetical protein ABI425_05550 [Patescibacteria group bacterium]
MEKILLIVLDWNLRQLYHELLLTRNLEVTPIDSIEDAIVLLSLGQFETIVLYTDEQSHNQVLTLLRLRKKYPRWQNLKFIILSADSDAFRQELNEADLIINPLLDSPVQVTDKIKKFINDTI